MSMSAAERQAAFRARSDFERRAFRHMNDRRVSRLSLFAKDLPDTPETRQVMRYLRAHPWCFEAPCTIGWEPSDTAPFLEVWFIAPAPSMECAVALLALREITSQTICVTGQSGDSGSWGMLPDDPLVAEAAASITEMKSLGLWSA